MCAQTIQDRWNAGEYNWVDDVMNEIVSQAWQPLYVVKVQMGEENVSDPLLFLQSQGGSYSPGVNHHGLIDQKPASPALLSGRPPLQQLIGPMTSQDSDLHRTLSSRP